MAALPPLDINMTSWEGVLMSLQTFINLKAIGNDINLLPRPWPRTKAALLAAIMASLSAIAPRPAPDPLTLLVDFPDPVLGQVAGGAAAHLGGPVGGAPPVGGQVPGLVPPVGGVGGAGVPGFAADGALLPPPLAVPVVGGVPGLVAGLGGHPLPLPVVPAGVAGALPLPAAVRVPAPQAGPLVADSDEDDEESDSDVEAPAVPAVLPPDAARSARIQALEAELAAERLLAASTPRPIPANVMDIGQFAVPRKHVQGFRYATQMARARRAIESFLLHGARPAEDPSFLHSRVSFFAELMSLNRQGIIDGVLGPDQLQSWVALQAGASFTPVHDDYLPLSLEVKTFAECVGFSQPFAAAIRAASIRAQVRKTSGRSLKLSREIAEAQSGPSSPSSSGASSRSLRRSAPRAKPYPRARPKPSASSDGPEFCGHCRVEGHLARACSTKCTTPNPAHTHCRRLKCT
ncbi:hypothetical protein HDU67_010178 [Dinochytrium kinnereticum]|nr:hypothetical protein HDU67_010178 [Dinochytrium kinnereticum]